MCACLLKMTPDAGWRTAKIGRTKGETDFPTVPVFVQYGVVPNTARWISVRVCVKFVTRVFSGTAFYVRNKTNGGGDGKRPGGYPISYIAGPAKVPEATQDSATPDKGGAKDGDAASAAPV